MIMNKIKEEETIEIKATGFNGLLVAFVLWLVSVIMKVIVGVISTIAMPLSYLFVKHEKSALQSLTDWFYNMALSNDQHGGVVNARSLQLTLTKRNTNNFKFGDPDDTVSYAIARNYYKGSLTWLGRFFAKVLDKIDSRGGGHMYKAIAMKIEADQEAILRIQENKYYE